MPQLCSEQALRVLVVTRQRSVPALLQLVGAASVLCGSSFFKPQVKPEHSNCSGLAVSSPWKYFSRDCAELQGLLSADVYAKKSLLLSPYESVMLWLCVNSSGLKKRCGEEL